MIDEYNCTSTIKEGTLVKSMKDSKFVIIHSEVMPLKRLLGYDPKMYSASNEDEGAKAVVLQVMRLNDKFLIVEYIDKKLLEWC